MIGSTNYPEASGGGVVIPPESQSAHVMLAEQQRRGSTCGPALRMRPLTHVWYHIALVSKVKTCGSWCQPSTWCGHLLPFNPHNSPHSGGGGVGGVAAEHLFLWSGVDGGWGAPSSKESNYLVAASSGTFISFFPGGEINQMT